MSKELVSFQDFKGQWTLQDECDDLFLDTATYGCHEGAFEKWLKNQRLFVKRYTENSKKSLMRMLLPDNKWFFYIDRFNQEMQTQYVINKYPNGFFEAVREDTGEVACFLPEPSEKYEFRISYYRANGPTYHECYHDSVEALTKLARTKFIAREGALDELVGTPIWNRGVYVCNWIAEGIHPMMGVKRDCENPEIQELFADDLKHIQLEGVA